MALSSQACSQVQRSRVLQVLAGAQKARQREEEVGLDLDRPGADFRHSVQGGRDLYKALCFDRVGHTCGVGVQKLRVASVSGAKRRSPPGAAAGRATCL